MSPERKEHCIKITAPTYGVDFELVQAIIAGGNQAIFKAIEGAEDDKELGKQDIIDRGVTSKDVICGIAASGRTPYVIGAMEYAKELGCAVLSITMNPNSEMSKKADLPINIIVGAEVIMGSTRMKSGTAQKMVCNMLTTASMVKMGKVYSNLMVDVKTSNEKLVERAKRIIMIATNVKYDVAEKFLEEADNSVKLAIFMIKSGLDKDSAKSILDRQEGYISEALKSIEKL
ncbi:SIS domain protein [Clostridioides difficile DA00256]|nr:SIS domain protein [Clostridioides difficile DA00256]